MSAEKKQQFIADILYKEAVKEEKEWRRKHKNGRDIIVIDKLLEDVQNIGYCYKYFVDLTNRDNKDQKLLHILLKYVGQFQDEEFSAQLVDVVGQRGNVWATEIILQNYSDLSCESKYKNAFYYDNALRRIKDKRYLSAYLQLLKAPEDAIKLPFTMIMLGQWNCEDAKPYFFKYLNADLLYRNSNISDLVFISLEALSYYRDDEAALKAIQEKLISSDKDLVLAAKKAAKRFEKRRRKTGDG